MSTTSTATREETTSSPSSLSCPFRSSSSNNNNHDLKTALLLEHQEHHPGTTTTTTTATATAPMEITATTTTTTTTASTTTTEQEDTQTSTEQQLQQPEPHYPKKLSNWVALRFLWATLRGKHHQYLLQLLQQHGDSFMIADQYVVLHDVHAIRDVLETHNLEKTIAVKRGYRNLFRHGKGGILAAPWKRWIEQRRLTAPAFTDRVIAEHLAPQFCHAARPVLQWLYEQIQQEEEEGAPGNSKRNTDSQRRRTPPIEMDQVFTSLTLDAIGLVLLGRSFGLGEQQLALSRQNRGSRPSGSNKSVSTTTTQGSDSHAAAAAAFADALQVLTRAAVRQIVFPRSILRLRPALAGRPQDIQQARTVIDDVLNDCIDQRLAAQHQHDKATKNGDGIGTSALASATDLMDILLQAEARSEISRADVKGQLLVFLFAGHDTTAHTLTWLLYEVSRNQELQQALYQEAQQAAAAAAAATSGSKKDHNHIDNNKDDDDMDWFGSMDPATLVTDLPLLNAVWMETNRLYPAAATGTTRGVGNRPLAVGQSGLVLPPRVSVSIPPYSLHRHAELWPDRPLEFDPYRFLGNTNNNHLPDTVDPMAFQAFSAGPRNCIGGRLARAEALFVVSALLRHFQVHPVQPPRGKRGRRRFRQRLSFWQRRAAPPPRPEELLSLTLRPKHGIWFEFEPRHQSSLSSPNNNKEEQS